MPAPLKALDDPEQMTFDLFDAPAVDIPVPDLDGADLVLVWSSGGKDSEAMLAEVVRQALELGRLLYPHDPKRILRKIVVGHNDMGDMEWWGTLDLAHRQAAHYGLPFRVVRRSDGLELLDDIALRGKMPDAARRWCTSDHKRGPGRTLLTALVRELGLDRPARVIQVYGLRAAESSGRAAKEAVAYNEGASGKGTVRQVTDWLPIHTWPDEQVWSTIRAEGLPFHWAYVRGMSRLSCSFCVLSARPDLITAARLRPRLLARYIDVESVTGSYFQVQVNTKNKVKTIVPKSIADLARYANFDQPPCENCSAGLEEGRTPVGVHAVPDEIAAAMFGRTGLVCDGAVMLDAATGRPASPLVLAA